jgi:serine/threonine protein kinase
MPGCNYQNARVHRNVLRSSCLRDRTLNQTFDTALSIRTASESSRNSGTGAAGFRYFPDLSLTVYRLEVSCDMLRSLRGLRESFDAAFAPGVGGAGDSYIGRTIHVHGCPPLCLGPVFAEGGFSLVHRADPQHLSSSPSAPPHPLAVKRMSIVDTESYDIAYNEASICAAVPPHPNLVRFHGSSLTPPDAFLAFEMVDGGTLPEVLARRKTPLSPDDALSILADAVAAIVHLHAQPNPVACRDVKLENLLYDRLTRRYKLCDLGSCTTTATRYSQSRHRELLEAEEVIKAQSSAAYRAPELCDLYDGKFVCEVCDVWSLGCVWYGVLFGKLPFGDGQSSLGALQGLRGVPSSPSWPESFTKLVTAMLTVDPAERPDSFTVLEAVSRLQGRDMDPELRKIGTKLRERRRRDFAGHSPSAQSVLEEGASARQPSRPSMAAAAASTALDASEGSFDKAYTTAAPSFATFVETEDAGGDGDGDWADFDSACDSSPAPALFQSPPAFAALQQRPAQGQPRVRSLSGSTCDGTDLAQLYGQSFAGSGNSSSRGNAAVVPSAMPKSSKTGAASKKDDVSGDLISFE